MQRGERVLVAAVAKNLLSQIVTQSAVADNVTVLFSGGKDSVVTLDLCHRFFKKINIVFMYYVNGLSFQNKIIRYYETKYRTECIKVPHFELSNFLRYGVFRPEDFEVPIVGTADVYNYIRAITGTYWIAGGERIDDSIVRRAMIKNSSSICEKRGRFYPLAEWSKKDVTDYIRKNGLKVSEESSVLGFSFRSLNGKELVKIKEHYPDDYAKINDWFPMADAELMRLEIEQNVKNEISDI